MESMRWENGVLMLLDQTRLPGEVYYKPCRDYREVAEAIKTLRVRGAPAIGAAAAYGMVLGALSANYESIEKYLDDVEKVGRVLKSTRPTAVNLAWAVDRMLITLRNAGIRDFKKLNNILLEEANKIYREDIDSNRKMGQYGQELIPKGASILTHCNAGALATAGYGTALGVIRAAQEAGKEVSVYADETRPLLQGARLTAWELMQDNIPVTLITDNMVGYLMSKRKVDLVIVGADRIAANGDVANKIGTYGVAVLAKEHKIPFYVAAPFSTVDLDLPNGDAIPIEERDANEVTAFGSVMVAPEGVKVWNPAFDVTPNKLVTAIITEKGVIKPEYKHNLRKLTDNP
ncbi:S-methyl-5-thioribose-1-phosphate isomerase [Desulfolucanica intricata]|uniref:S-methyl-5-thioribose-1-phosphate isomerase n=1 Tax=Desulfolucanica intricata TaxID=1285191 RepID=UPI00082B7404|nr:S-methyl-5-thioribose-1-phosphate isomerase [Desulfolucanica intricata]